MAEWLTLLDQLEIPDGAVLGLSASDKPVLKGKLLQLPAADRPLFFDGSPLEALKTLCTLLPDVPSGLKSLDEVSILAAATARELQRLQQEEDSDISSCVASWTIFQGVDCILPAKAEQKPTQLAYVWEDPEDSRQEAAKIVARLSQELELPTKKLHATTVFANFLGKVQRAEILSQQSLSVIPRRPCVDTPEVLSLI